MNFADIYNYSTNVSQQSGMSSAFNITLFLVCIALVIGIYAVGSWIFGRIFKKAGVEPWKAWVPIYNIWITFKLGDQAGWWTILLFIPVINIVANIVYYIAMYRIGLKFGKSGVFVLWAIFLPIVWYVWLAFDDSTWHDSDESTGIMTPPPFVPPAGPSTPQL